MASSTFNERDFIRQQIEQIVIRHLNPEARLRIKRRAIIKKSYQYEMILYKRSLCMAGYSDPTTLETRVIMLADAIASLHRSRRVSGQGPGP